MLVTMLKSMLHEYAQRRHSSDDVHGPAALLRAAVAADRGDGPTTPRRYSEDAQHWIGNVTPSLSCTALLVNASQAATATRMGLCFFFYCCYTHWFFSLRCSCFILVSAIDKRKKMGLPRKPRLHLADSSTFFRVRFARRLSCVESLPTETSHDKSSERAKRLSVLIGNGTRLPLFILFIPVIYLRNPFIMHSRLCPRCQGSPLRPRRVTH